MTDRDWRDAKMPKWALDAVTSELAQWELTAALSWPNEARPEPLAFRWGDYDALYGEAVPGEYWGVKAGGVVRFFLRPKRDDDRGWKQWRFSYDGERWTESVERGPIYGSERDARLAVLWNACEESAAKLAFIRAKLRRAQ